MSLRKFLENNKNWDIIILGLGFLFVYTGYLTTVGISATILRNDFKYINRVKNWYILAYAVICTWETRCPPTRLIREVIILIIINRSAAARTGLTVNGFISLGINAASAAAFGKGRNRKWAMFVGGLLNASFSFCFIDLLNFYFDYNANFCIQSFKRIG